MSTSATASRSTPTPLRRADPGRPGNGSWARTTSLSWPCGVNLAAAYRACRRAGRTEACACCADVRSAVSDEQISWPVVAGCGLRFW